MISKQPLNIFGLALLIVGAILVVSPLTSYCHQSCFFSEKQSFQPREPLVVAEFPVRSTRPHLLKIKHLNGSPIQAIYTVNDTLIQPEEIFHVKIKGTSRTAYMKVTSEMLAGRDSILVQASFGQSTPKEVSIQLSNYRKKLPGGLYVVFSDTGYSVAATRTFFRSLTAIILVAMTASYLISSKSGRIDQVITLRVLNSSPPGARWVLFWLALIAAANIWLYWPSLRHIFRHDEWFFLFSTRDQSPDFRFFLQHIDWQLKLPYDRLMFRPIHHGMLAFNRWAFDTSYAGPHILTLGKHLIAVGVFWWMLNEFNRNRSSLLFAMLFSALTINVDPVIWPHIDAYIVTTILTLLSIVFFRRTLQGRISPFKGALLTSLTLFCNLLTTEIAFLLPMVFFLLYWVAFRRSQQETKAMDRASWLAVILPYGLWAILFGLHLAMAYPDFNMTPQSGSAGLLAPLVNLARMLLVIVTAIISPMVQTSYGDKIYCTVTAPCYVWTLAAVLMAARYRKNLFRGMSRQSLLILLPLLSIAATLCLGRAAYLQSMLRSNNMVCHYSYCLSALILAFVYCAVDFNAVAATLRLKRILLLAIVVLIVSNSANTRQAVLEVEHALSPLKTYCDEVEQFVRAHESEPDFNFKVLDRPPEIDAFDWYSQTCIEGLFDRYIDVVDPAYILAYDYNSQQIRAARREPPSPAPRIDDSYSPPQGDFTDDHGISFRSVRLNGHEVLAGVSEVTQRQWTSVMGDNPSRFNNDDLPVENVSFEMALQFIARLNENLEDARYRLPTLAEYHHLVNTGSIEFAKIKSKPVRYAWTNVNADSITHPVGSLNPTDLGVYDVIGNVWEWTSTPIHMGSPSDQYPDNPRMCFGLSWRDSIKDRPTLTTNYMPQFRHENLGLRLIRQQVAGDR